MSNQTDGGGITLARARPVSATAAGRPALLLPALLAGLTRTHVGRTVDALQLLAAHAHILLLDAAAHRDEPLPAFLVRLVVLHSHDFPSVWVVQLRCHGRR